MSTTAAEYRRVEAWAAECDRRAEKAKRNYAMAHWSARAMGARDAILVLKGKAPDEAGDQ